MYKLDPYAQRKLSKEEQEIVKYIKPKYQKEFAKLSSHKRARIIRNIALDLQRKGHDISELGIMNENNAGYMSYKMAKYSARGVSKPIRMAIKHKRKVRDTKYYVKREAMKVGMKPKDDSKKAIKEFNKNNKKFNKAFDKLNGKVEKKNVRLAKRQKLYSKIGAKLDVFFKSHTFSGNAKKGKSINEIRRQYEQKMLDKIKSKATQKGMKAGGKVIGAAFKLIIKIIAALFSFLTTLMPIVMVVLVVVLIITSIIAIFVADEEERLKEQNQAIYGTYSISAEVEQYRDKILKEAKKYGREQYIDLYLAVVMQESGGKGSDIFQCSESLGKPRNSLSVDASIKQGVKYLSGMLKRAKPKNPKDIAKIKIALQGYNFGGGYIDFINRGAIEAILKSGGGDKKWTQKNVLAYQKEKSGGKKRTGEAKNNLGPYAYGDAYYTEHVLRYYPLAEGFSVSVKAGVAAKINKAKRLQWLFGGSPPSSQSSVQKYLTRINVPIINEKGKKSSMVLTVHKKLASEFKAIFSEMQKTKFPIKPSSTCAYVWKTIIGTHTISQHSYGIAIDINWNDNPCFYNTYANVSNGYGSYRPGINKFSVTKQVIKIWKSHGFGWGGDWTGKKDTMHFSYTE